MIKIRRIPMICLFLSSHLIWGSTGSTAVTDRIVEVTVFPDRAEVVRETRVELPRGRSVIEFDNLPPDIDRESLRVTARGVEATLGAVELREFARPPVATAELTAAETLVRSLESELAKLAGENETDAELRSFLGALKVSTTTRESEKLGEGRADPEALRAIYNFMQSGLEDLGKRKVSRARQREELEENLRMARARLSVLRPAGPIRVRRAGVEVVAASAGALTLRLSYLTPGACWRPGYRASLDAVEGEVRLDTEAMVRQTTGEDWNGVSLRLSTAAPSRGVRPPVLEPWLLAPFAIGSRRDSGGFAFNQAKVEADAGYPAADAAEPAEKVAARQEAILLRSSYNLVFEVPGLAEIPGDGADHLVALRRDRLRGEVEYHVIPMLSESAFLVVRTKAPSTHPLLAGPIHSYAGGAYLGAAGMPETGPGGDLTLPFGSDNRITVKRTRLPEEHRDAGVGGKDRRIAWAYRTTVENLLGSAATVVLEERIPVSQDARIEVETGRKTTPGGVAVMERPGIMRWSLTLDPGARREIAVDYAVRFPGDLVIAGL